jgi:hypothetical protein
MKKWTSKLNRAFSKEVRMAKKQKKKQKNMKKCLIFLVIKEMQFKTTLIFYLTIIKNTETRNVGEDVGKKEPSYSVGI